MPPLMINTLDKVIIDSETVYACVMQGAGDVEERASIHAGGS